MQIILTNNLAKKDILLNSHSLKKEKILTIEDLVKKYPYTYGNNTIEYVMGKYKVNLDVAKTYLEAITLYPIELLTNEKGLFLTQMKKELISKKFLIQNQLLNTYLKQDIHLLNLYPTKTLSNYLNHKNLIFEKPKEGSWPTVYELINKEEEITFIGHQIVHLIKEGKDINHIYLTNVLKEDKILIQRVFSLLHIPINLKEESTINQTHLGSFYLTHRQNEDVFVLLSNMAHTQEEQSIVETIITIVNKYVGYEHQEDFVYEKLCSTSVKRVKESNTVQLKDFEKNIFTAEDYVFLINANEGIFPRTTKEEDYLEKDEKECMNIDTSDELNALIKEYDLERIKACNHLVITYIKKDGNKELEPSSLLKNFSVIKNPKIPYDCSHLFNQITYAKDLDQYLKYHIVSERLLTFKKAYTIPYLSYQHTYQKIHNFIDTQYTLSYTSLDTYLKCPFCYYLTYVLKIKPDEERISLILGKIFHKCLELKETKSLSLKETYQQEIAQYELNSKDKYFLNKAYQDLEKLIEILIHQEQFTKLHHEYHEKTITIPINEHVNFTGKIDKIKYLEIGHQNIVAIIDYKTGNSKLDESLIPLGYSLQLPIYLYLIRKSSLFAHPILGGIYIQNIFPGLLKWEDNKSYEQLEHNAYKLKGFSTTNQEILQLVDQSYLDSNIIASLKIKKDMNFYQYSKVINQEDENKLIQIVDNKIKETIEHIDKAEFPMTATIIDHVNISCVYCPFNGICYHNAGDNRYLEKDHQFLKKEENHGMDE